MKAKRRTEKFKQEQAPFFKAPRIVDSFSEVPARFDQKDLYIVQKSGKRKWLLLMCPDHCGQRLELNLMTSQRPCWKISIRKGKISVHPSIVVESCGAHFWLKQSDILWASELD